MPSRQDDQIVRQIADGERKTRKGRRQPLTLTQTNRQKTRRKRNKVMYAEAMRFAQQLGIELAPHEPVTEILKKTFARTHALWQHAAAEVDMLDADAPAGKKDSIWTWRWDEQGNKLVEPQKWIKLEAELRTELFQQAAMMQKLNIDEAAVRVEQAKLDVLSQALRSAVKKAGVPEDMQRAIGAALRAELMTIEGTAHDNPTDSERETEAA